MHPNPSAAEVGADGCQSSSVHLPISLRTVLLKNFTRLRADGSPRRSAQGRGGWEWGSRCISNFHFKKAWLFLIILIVYGVTIKDFWMYCCHPFPTVIGNNNYSSILVRLYKPPPGKVFEKALPFGNVFYGGYWTIWFSMWFDPSSRIDQELIMIFG